MNEHDQLSGDRTQSEGQGAPDSPQHAPDTYTAGTSYGPPQPQQSYQYDPQGNYQGQQSQSNPQQQGASEEYGPGNQPTYNYPAQPQQQGGGDYRPPQPQYGGGDYYPGQPQPSQPYYTGGPPSGPPPVPPGKRGLPVWAWAVPLLIILLGAGGFGAWAYMTAQEKAATEAQATTTAVAQAKASSTSQAQGTSTAVVRRKTSTAVAQVTSTAQAEANTTATAIEVAFATMMAGGGATPTALQEEIEPIRMPLADFIKLYNDPVNRPIIVDVRSNAAYDEGHIAGAVNIPGFEAEMRLSELPKEKLIIAYCQ
jgi:hypothetical protein